jgi:hypothetical protein
MPSYTYSTGQTGSQTTLSINTGTVASPVWKAIEQIQDIAQSGKKLGTVNSTNLQSTVSEIIPTLPDEGDLKVTAIRVPTSDTTGQAAVLANFNNGSEQVPVEFKLALPPDAAAGQTTTGDSAIFTGYITELNDFSGISAEKLVMFEFTVKVISPYVQTNGS